MQGTAAKFIDKNKLKRHKKSMASLIIRKPLEKFQKSEKY